MTSVRDRLWVPEPKKLIHGHGMVELFRERDKKLQHRQEFENYIGVPIERAMAWAARRVITSNVGLGYNQSYTAPIGISGSTYQYGTNNFDTLPGGALWALQATDASHAEDPTERFVYGNCIAHTYQGMLQDAAKRGQMNTGECAADYLHAKFVFDWPTNSGNGTFQSLYWCTPVAIVAPTDTGLYPVSAPGDPTYDIADLYGYKWTSLSFSGVSNSYVLTSGIAIDGADSFWSYNNQSPNGEAVQRKMSDGSVLAHWDFSSFLPSAICFDGTYLWIGEGIQNGGTGRIRKYDTAGNVIATYANPSGGSTTCLGIAWDGANIFALYYVSGTSYKVYKLATDGSTLATLTLSPQPVTGSVSGTNTGFGYSALTYVPWDGGVLLLGGYLSSSGGNNTANVLVIDPSTGVVKAWFAMNPSYANPIAYDVVNDLVYYVYANYGSTSTAIIYKWKDPQSVMARALLENPVTKSNLQTMKITYQFDFA